MNSEHKPIFKSYKNGKLLLTSEYMVLRGAKAFALPTKYGQTLEVYSTSNSDLEWEVWDYENKLIYRQTFDTTTRKPKGEKHTWDKTVKKLISKCSEEYIKGRKLVFQQDFPNQWGLGTSSTLLALFAEYSQLDPYKLLAKTFGGSGYDIACAEAASPIVFQIKDGKPTYEKCEWNPSYADKLYWVYMNKKQVSSKEVERFEKIETKEKHVEFFTERTEMLLRMEEDLHLFQTIILQHEKKLSKILGRPSVCNGLFKGYSKGMMKSIGAWGGDFALVVIQEESDLDYFRERGFNTLLKFYDLVAKS